jgi:hypothetical protein
MHVHQNVFHPDVTDTITGVLVKHGYRNGEVEDAVCEVRVRVIEALEDRKAPTTIGQWKALGAKVAADYAVDEHRKSKVREKYDVGLCEAPDDHAPFLPSGVPRDPVDAKRQLAVLMGMFEKGEMPELGKEILEGVADGMKVPAIGRELGLPAKEVRSRLGKMRRLFFRRLGLLGMAVMMMLLMVIAGGPAVVALWKPPAAPSGAGTVEVRALPSPQEMAAVMRQEAVRACDARRWEECEARLDEARRLDPEGEGAAEVKAAREKVRAAWSREERELEAKPR